MEAMAQLRKSSGAAIVSAVCGTLGLFITGLNIYLHGFHRVNEGPSPQHSDYWQWQLVASIAIFAAGIARIVDWLGKR